MEWNMEGFIDRYGMPVFYKPENLSLVLMESGIIQTVQLIYWKAEVESLKKDARRTK